MSDLSTSLILTGDARGLISATRDGESALKKLDQATAEVGRTSTKTATDLTKLQAQKKGVRQAADETTTAMQRQIQSLVGYDATTKSARQSANSFNAALDQGKTRFDALRGSLDPLYRSSRQYEAIVQETQRAVLSGAATQGEANRVLALAEAQYLATGNAAGTMARTGNMASGQLGNIAAQFNDIGVMLASGQNPLQLALQQGTQLNQVFATMGSGRNVLRGIASAFVGMINPVSLATIGIIAGGAALIQWASSADEADEAGDTFVEMLRKVRDEAKDARDQVDLFLSGFETVEQLRLNEQIDELNRQASALRNSVEFMPGSSPQRSQTMSEADDLDREAAILQEALDLRAANVAEAKRLKIAEESVKEAISSTLGDLITTTKSRVDGMIVAQEMLTVLQEEFAISQAIKTYGEDSVEVAELRVGAARRLLVEQLETIDASEMMKIELLEAWDAANGVASVDMAGNIALAANEASRLSQGLATALDLARRTAGYSAQVNNNGLDTLDPRNPNNVRPGTWTGGYSTTSPFDPGRAPKVPAGGRSSGRSGGGRGRGGQSEEEKVLSDIARQMDRIAPSYERDLKELEEWRSTALSTLNPAREGYQAFADDVEFIFGERLAEAYRKDLEQRGDWAAGVERAFLDINDDMATFANVGESLATKWTSGLEDAFVEMGRTGKFEVGSLIDYTLEQFQRLAFQQSIQPGLEAGFGFLTDFIGGLFPSAGGASAPMTQSHSGSTIGAGGVRRSYGTSSPLRADERLTVTTLGQRVFTPEQIGNGATVVDALANAAAANGGGGSVVFAPNISVENNSSTPVQGEMEETNDGQGGRSYKLVLADQVGAAMNQPGGGARKTLRRNGLKPKRAQR